jgi:hypothetical protein
MANDISIAASSGRALDAAALTLDAQATTAPPAAGVENIAARQQIRDAFINVAGGANDIGNGPHERQVDKLLFDMLPKIDFSAPGGQAYAKEIGDFISTAGDRFTGAEVQHLHSLLDEAAAALPAGGSITAPSPTPVDNPKSDLLDLLGDIVQSLRDGQLDSGERKDLLGQLGDLIRQLAGGGDGPTVHPDVAMPVTTQPAPAPSVAVGEPAPAGSAPVSNAPQERPQEPTSHIPEAPDRAHAQSVRAGDADPAAAAERANAAGPDAQAQATTAPTAGAKPAEAEATSSTTAIAKVEDPAPAQNDKVLAGVLSLLGDVLTAQKDGQLDHTERQQLLSDLTKLVQSLVGDGAPATGGVDPKPASGPGSATPATPTTQEPRMHDAVWFLEKSGLANFLSGFFSNNTSQLTNMVMQTLRATEPKANA